MDKYSKYVVIVMILCSLILFGSINASAQPLGILSQQQKKAERKTLSSPNGRFVFGQISDSNKDQFMLDTATGRLWRISESGRIGIFLKNVPYRNDAGECFDLPGGQSKSGKKKAKK